MSENTVKQVQAGRGPNISERISGLLDAVLEHAHENEALSAKLHQQLLGSSPDELPESEPKAEDRQADGFLGRVEGTLRTINHILRNAENTSKSVLEQF